ncbi:hypothetical protein [Yoonia sp. MH D7]
MRFVTLALLPILAACATPREACLASVSNEQRVVQALIVETRGNLARGYAVETEQRVRKVPSRCSSKLPDGTVVRIRCSDVVVRDVTVPVAVDLNAERAKLVSLEERQQQMLSNANSARAQCIATYPE